MYESRWVGGGGGGGGGVRRRSEQGAREVGATSDEGREGVERRRGGRTVSH